MSDVAGMPIEADLTVDASGLACPMPVIRAKKGITSVEIGQVVEILSTDPGSMADFKAWARSTGHELLSAEQKGEVYRFFIRRSK
jgi:tRNA 2-thiouridine synthesizing protein A